MSFKILQIQSFDWGGAAKAALRLHIGFVNTGVDAAMLLKWKSKKDIQNGFEYVAPPEVYTLNTKISNKLNQYKRKLLPQTPIPDYLANKPNGFHQFSLPVKKYKLAQHPLVKEADIIHLHWASDFIHYEEFFKGLDKPVVWTLHDMNPFTGGCHHAMQCTLYTKDCGYCFQLEGTVNPSITKQFLQEKFTALNGFNKLTVVTPSHWLGVCSQSSTLFSRFNHKVIHNGFDTDVFKPANKQFARSVFGLPENDKVILFVAGDIDCIPKGYHLLKEALKDKCFSSGYALCAVGEMNTNVEAEAHVFEIGSVQDERLMALLYAAADVFVTPSLADNLPNTVAESLLCGTPVVGFPVGGINDMLTDYENGLLCKDCTSDALSTTLQAFFSNITLFNKETIAQNARKLYDIKTVVPQYLDLYQSLLQHNK